MSQFDVHAISDGIMQWLASLATECVVCGMVGLKPGRVVCGDECRSRYTEVTYKPVPARVMCCQTCGVEWEGKGQQRFCVRCGKKRARLAKKIQERRRKLRMQANAPCERIDPVEVFIRDNWVCGICGKKVRQNAHYNHDHAATLDHIVPLAKGGAHAMSNVQCSHRACNLRKSDKSGGQLRLIG